MPISVNQISLHSGLGYPATHYWARKLMAEGTVRGRKARRQWMMSPSRRTPRSKATVPPMVRTVDPRSAGPPFFVLDGRDYKGLTHPVQEFVLMPAKLMKWVRLQPALPQVLWKAGRALEEEPRFGGRSRTKRQDLSPEIALVALLEREPRAALEAYNSTPSMYDRVRLRELIHAEGQFTRATNCGLGKLIGLQRTKT